MAEETRAAAEEAEAREAEEAAQGEEPHGAEYWRAQSRKWEARSKENARAARENADAAAELAALKEAEKTDLQRATERAEKAEALVARFEADARRAEVVAKVAASTGLPQELVATLAGDDEDALSAAAGAWAQAISQARPPVMPSVPADRSAGTGPAASSGQLFAEWFRNIAR